MLPLQTRGCTAALSHCVVPRALGLSARLSTTTTGLSDSVTTIRLFQIISAEQTIIARLSTWCAICGAAPQGEHVGGQAGS